MTNSECLKTSKVQANNQPSYQVVLNKSKVEGIPSVGLLQFKGFNNLYYPG